MYLIFCIYCLWFQIRCSQEKRFARYNTMLFNFHVLAKHLCLRKINTFIAEPPKGLRKIKLLGSGMHRVNGVRIQGRQQRRCSAPFCYIFEIEISVDCACAWCVCIYIYGVCMYILYQSHALCHLLGQNQKVLVDFLEK